MRMNLIALVLVACVAGCREGDSVTMYQTPKETPGHAAAPAAEVQPQSPTAPAGQTVVSWDLPAGWKQVQSTESMRFATLQVGADPSLVTTVSILPASDLLSNVNRWRGQLGLQPTDQSGMSTMVSRKDVAGVPADLVDLVAPAEGSPGKRMLAAVLTRGNQAWFFKLTGPGDTIAAQKENFEKFILSVRFEQSPAGVADAPAQPAGAGPVAGADGQAPLPDGHPPLTVIDPGAASGIAAWKPPADWQRDADKPMRVATFRVAASGVELIISRFAAGGFGSPLDNINRWRAQVGLPPINDEAAEPSTKLTIDGQPGAVYDFVGKPEGQSPAKRVRVAMVNSAGEVWFFKMQGTEQGIKDQVAAFDAFLLSIRFATGG